MKHLSILFSLFIGLALVQSVWANKETNRQRLVTTKSCVGCNLKGIKLTETELGAANLTRVNLTEADLRAANLSKANLTSANLSRTDLRGANLTEADLRAANLSKANLTGANLKGANLDGSNLSEAILSGASLSGVSLNRAKLNRANLTHTDLDSADLAEADLSQGILVGANLSGADLSDTNLRGVNLSFANLNGVNLNRADLAEGYLYDATMIKADLREANLEGARISGVNLTDANLEGVNLGVGKIEVSESNGIRNGVAIKEAGIYGEITSFDLTGDANYLTSRSGRLYELKEGRSRVLLDLTENKQFLYKDEVGLLSVVSKNDFIYISYTIQEDSNEENIFLVVDQYTKKMRKTRRVVKIKTASSSHVAGTLGFDNLGKLYLSVGDGREPEDQPQSMQSLLGKILRIDVSKARPEPEIVAYGLRNPWKFSIDARNRMFIGDVGGRTKESIYLLEDLYPVVPFNLGWPIFEGTTRMRNSPLRLDDTLLPIFEYRYGNPQGIAVIGGHYLDDNDVYLFGDLLGNLRLLRKHLDNKWHEIHFQKTPNMIWSLGYDSITKMSYMSGAEKIFQMEVLNKQINRFSSVKFCRTTMPDGAVNYSGC